MNCIKHKTLNMKYSFLIALLICSFQLTAQDVFVKKADSTKNETNVSIRLRCRSILNYESPLFVIDNNIIQRGKNDEIINQLDLSKVKSMSVLKGASATALYGAAGAAGVIIITTKDKCEDKVIAGEKCF
jgi:TonB-dependent starch-binding outer membrane protein SusC